MCSVQYRRILSEGKLLLSAITVNISVALRKKGLMLGFTYGSSTFSDSVLNAVLIFVLSTEYGQPDPLYHMGTGNRGKSVPSSVDHV